MAAQGIHNGVSQPGRYPGEASIEHVVEDAQRQQLATSNSTQSTNMQISLQLTPSQLDAIRQHAFRR